MKTIYPIIVFIALMLNMACGKNNPAQVKNNDTLNAQQQAKDTLTVNPLQEDTIATVDSTQVREQPVDISGIQEVWRNDTIIIEEATVNIQNLAKAFCGQYAGFQPNKVLLDYLLGEMEEEDKEAYAVNLEQSNGYVAIETTTELPTGTTICYWNKRGGLRLVGVWMEQTTETEKPEKLLLFYDYNPQTKKLTPQTKLVDELQRITKKFKSWSLRLPAEGRDIEIMEFSGEDHSDTFQCTYYTWKWNGTSFHFDPNGHE